MRKIDEKPLLQTIHKLDHNIKRFAYFSMFVVRWFFVCEIIGYILYISQYNQIYRYKVFTIIL